MDERPIEFDRLTSPAPPDDLWPAIAGELDRRRRGRGVRRLGAVAAVIALVVLAVVVVERPVPPNPEAGAGGATVETLAELRAASARLETRLAEQRMRVVDGGELESLVWLEAELAWLDEQLAEAPADRELWRQRVELLRELHRRYAGGDWRNEMQLASV